MNRRVLMIAAGVSVGLVLLWFVALWGPRSSELDDARERSQLAEDEAQRLQIRLQRLEGLEERAPALRSDLEELRAAVPDGPELASFILSADDAASRSGISFVSITPGVPSQPDDEAAPAEMSITVNAAGGYFQTLDFLNRLYDLDRVLVIDNLTVASSNQGGVVELTTTVAGRIFTTEAPAVAPGDEAGGEATTTTVAAEA